MRNSQQISLILPNTVINRPLPDEANNVDNSSSLLANQMQINHINKIHETSN